MRRSRSPPGSQALLARGGEREGDNMNGEADRREHILKALARYEANGKAKRGKRKAVKLFSVDRHEPQRERRNVASLGCSVNEYSNMGTPGRNVWPDLSSVTAWFPIRRLNFLFD